MLHIFINFLFSSSSTGLELTYLFIKQYGQY